MFVSPMMGVSLCAPPPPPLIGRMIGAVDEDDNDGLNANRDVDDADGTGGDEDGAS